MWGLVSQTPLTFASSKDPLFDFSSLDNYNILFGLLPFPYAEMLFQPDSMISLALIIRFHFLKFSLVTLYFSNIVYTLHLCIESPIPIQPFPVSMTTHKWPPGWFLLS